MQPKVPDLCFPHPAGNTFGANVKCLPTEWAINPQHRMAAKIRLSPIKGRRRKASGKRLLNKEKSYEFFIYWTFSFCNLNRIISRHDKRRRTPPKLEELEILPLLNSYESYYGKIFSHFTSLHFSKWRLRNHKRNLPSTSCIFLKYLENLGNGCSEQIELNLQYSRFYWSISQALCVVWTTR